MQRLDFRDFSGFSLQNGGGRSGLGVVPVKSVCWNASKQPIPTLDSPKSDPEVRMGSARTLAFFNFLIFHFFHQDFLIQLHQAFWQMLDEFGSVLVFKPATGVPTASESLQKTFRVVGNHHGPVWDVSSRINCSNLVKSRKIRLWSSQYTNNSVTYCSGLGATTQILLEKQLQL